MKPTRNVALGILTLTLIGMVVVISSGPGLQAQTCSATPACLTTNTCIFGTPVPLNVFWRNVLGGRDRTTTELGSERDANPLEGQVFYVPRANPLTGTVAL